MRSMSLDRLYLQVALEGWIGWKLPKSFHGSPGQATFNATQPIFEGPTSAGGSQSSTGEVCPFLPWFCRKNSREVQDVVGGSYFSTGCQLGYTVIVAYLCPYYNKYGWMWLKCQCQALKKHIEKLPHHLGYHWWIAANPGHEVPRSC